MDKENKVPVFAVVLPVYNEEQNIANCLNSIINQTFEDWVCYICNDCSSDKTSDICKEYVENDSRFILINSKYNKYTEDGNLHYVNKDMAGISKMLNLGIAVSKSKYILRMDGDDIMTEDRMQITYDWMESHPECDIAGFPMIYNNEVCNLSKLTEGGNCTFSLMAQNIKPYHPTACLRRDTVMKKTKFLYQQPYDGCEDAFFWFHAKMWGCKIMLADTKPVIVYMGGHGTKLQSDLFNRLTLAYSHAIVTETVKAELAHYKQTNKLSVVIGFKNEGIEVEKTVLSLLLSDNNINIILVNDNSDDDYDYKHVADTFGCFYIKSNKSLGCAGARCEGVKYVNTPYFILMDAHMRININQKNFSERFVNELEAGDDKIVQCNTVIIRSNAEEDAHFRTYINEDCMFKPEGAACIGAKYNHNHTGRDWAADWCYTYLDSNGKDEEINKSLTPDSKVECISLMGADYAMSVRWWNKIGGLEGLYCWGHDEPLLSIKTYLMGGKIITFPKYGIGHLYRTKTVYGKIDTHISFTNLLFIQYIMSHAESEYETDEQIFDKYKSYMQYNLDEETFKLILETFNKNKKQYDKIKEYIWGNAVRTLEDIKKLESRLN